MYVDSNGVSEIHADSDKNSDNKRSVNVNDSDSNIISIVDADVNEDSDSHGTVDI